MDTASSTASNEGQNLVYGEEYDMTSEWLGEHGIVATPSYVRYQLVVGILAELGEVEPLSCVSRTGLYKKVGCMGIRLKIRMR